MFRFEVPATLSNFGAGFDVVGMAVSLANTFTVDVAPTWSADGAPVAPGDHLVTATALAAAARFGAPLPGPLSVAQDERVPRSRGLGSSATARVAGVVAWAWATGARPPLRDLLAFLAEAEGHPDNAAAAMLGGVVMSTGAEDMAWRRLAPPPGLDVVALVPDVLVATDDARRVLPASYPRADVVFNHRRLALLVYGLMTGDADALELGVEDRVHHPYRKGLIGPVDATLAAARDAGAVAAFISGSGSTLAALVPTGVDGVGAAMVAAFGGGQAHRLAPRTAGAWAALDSAPPPGV